MRRQRGLTLVELVVSLAIAAILTTLALPSVTTLLVGNRIRTGGTDLMTALLLARSEAIKRNAQVAVQPANGNWSQGWAVAAVASGEQFDVKSAPGADVQVTGPAAGIVYDRNGRLAAFGTAKVELADVAQRATSRCVAVDLSGLPRIIQGSCT